MDSPLISNVFRRLLSHQTCSRLRYYSPKRNLPQDSSLRRHYRTSNDAEDDSSQTSDWQQRTDIFPPDKLRDYERYPMVTAEALRSRRERPRRVKMLTRDFIEGTGMSTNIPRFTLMLRLLLDSLYNPHYGYFPKQVVIFSPGQPFDFNSMANEPEFHKQLGERYTAFEDELDVDVPNESRQLWHTPTELFRPYYGEAIAQYLVTNYKLKNYPLHDLIIYELGAGNGTLMLNILDYIRDFEPEVYARTKFKVIEISSALASLQTSQLTTTASARGHTDHVEIINRSVFAWDIYVPVPCYFLALEVFDNFAHDSIRYDPFTEEPLQGTVLVDNMGDFYEFYSKQIDPIAARFLRVRNAACSRPFDHPLRGSRFIRKFKSSLPFAANLTVPEYIPTKLMQFFDILREYFPLHQLLTSDFHALPDAVKGFNAPVVQTRFQRRVVPVSTPYVQQGYFDILFPTDFSVIEDLYRALTHKLTRVMRHEEFLKRWAYVEDSATKSGENPMLSW
ncbi:hypothetical protein ACLMJK_006744 [Lecanora helva]